MRKKIYRKGLMLMLGATKAVSEAPIPDATPKAAVLKDSFKASTDMLHLKLSELDDEVGSEFVKREDRLDRRLGRKKFYSQKEIELLKRNRDRISV
ncbi:MAG: hypothetical protein ABEJ83_05135 [Candidatus Nanohaloarchaea archaeon]